MLKYVVCLCKGCDGCCVCCLYCVLVHGKYECMFVSCVHPVSVLNVAFCMTCSLLMLVKDARGDHMEEAYSRTGLMTA